MNTEHSSILPLHFIDEYTAGSPHAMHRQDSRLQQKTSVATSHASASLCLVPSLSPLSAQHQAVTLAAVLAVAVTPDS